jgi:hypothetical protein
LTGKDGKASEMMKDVRQLLICSKREVENKPFDIQKEKQTIHKEPIPEISTARWSPPFISHENQSKL